MGREAFSFIERCGPTDIVLEQLVEFRGEGWVVPGLGRRLLQLRQGRHQGLWNVLPTEATEASVGSRTHGRLQAGGIRSAGVRQGAGHRGSTAERRFGGQYVPETLMPALAELEQAA